MTGSLRRRPMASAWAPMHEPLFRSLWIAAVISYTGTWMQNVGAGWLMTQLTMSPLMVSLVTAATTLPVFLVMLPAGALADLVDRRRFLLITQSWMVAASAVLGILTLLKVVTPWTLLAFTFLLGLGAVTNDPAWQAITPEIVCAENHAPAVALNSVGFNVARAVGPAMGGLVIAAAGSGWAFLLNAASFFGVIFFLYRWKRPHFEHLETGRVGDALLAGLRYVRGAAVVRSVLIRTVAFSLAASSLPALLPIIAQPHGATGYGLLLGSFGFGALLFASGTAWIAILACLNVAAQTMSPSFLRARALSMYLLVLQGGMALGATAWGALATRVGVPQALLFSAVALMAGLVTVPRHRLTSRELEFTPSVVRD